MRICMLAYAFYESDTRIMQYATALTKREDVVDVIALRRNQEQPEFEIINGVNVYRIQSRTVNEKGKLSYTIRILRFLLHSAIVLARRHRANPYQLVHVHNVPDFLVFAAIVPKLAGIPVILDIHDLLPEFYASKFKISHDSLLFRLLVQVERCSAAFANHVIIANHIWGERLISRSAPARKCSVVRNYPDLEIFVAYPQQARNRNGKFRLTYPGSLNWHQGLDVAIRAFSRITDQMPDAEFHIYGEGPAKPSLIDLVKQLGLSRVIFHDFLPSHEIAKVMADTDLAIEPKRATSAFGNEALSTKILEFMALGVPVVASRTKIHAYYYDNSMVKYYDSDSEDELAECMLLLKDDPELRQQFADRAREYASENSWQVRKGEYLALVDSLVNAHTKMGSSRARESTVTMKAG